MKMKKISLISPSRNNLKYLKWSYESVRKNCTVDVEYCVASDYSDDGTVEWCEETAKKDKNFKYIVNDGTWFGERLPTIDPEAGTGDDIPIEERDSEEVSHMSGITDTGSRTNIQISNPGSEVRNPAFDVTPAELITGFITPDGLISPS